MKKIFKFLLFAISMNSSLFAIGYNVNLELAAGFSECLFGEEIEKNKNVWENFGNFENYINTDWELTADIVFKQNFSAVTGIQFKSVQLNYITKDGNAFGNDIVHIHYPSIKIPIMAKYDFVINKTTEVIDSICVAAGLNVSYIVGKQSYKDSLTNYVGDFISKPFNIGVSTKVTFSHKIGPGKAYAGIKSDMNFLPQGYKIGGKDVLYGNVFSVAPVIGYTFIIKEDKELAKITEKNKRIKDISVE